MHILLFGDGGTISTTTLQMLDSVEGWSVENVSSLDGNFDFEDTDIDVIVANLIDFPPTPTSVVKKISNHFPGIPILALYAYDKKLLIEPLLQAGAQGYLKNGTSEETLVETVRSVTDGEKIVITENT